MERYSNKFKVDIEVWVTHISDMPSVAEFRKLSGIGTGRDWRAAVRYPDGRMYWEWLKTEKDAISWCESLNKNKQEQ